MLYYFLRLPIFLAFMVFYRKQNYYSFMKRVSRKEAYVFAMNHPTAFLDPILIAGIFPQSLNFLLRGDVFTSNFVQSLLRGVHTIPIYRERDGIANLRKNEEIIEYCHDLLGENKNLVILAEGFTEHGKRLKPIQKGLARIVFGSYDKHHNENIVIVPAGANYTNSDKFRGDAVTLSIGKPLYLKDYLDAHKDNPRKAIRLLTNDVAKALKEEVVHIEKKEDEPTTNKLLYMTRRDFKEGFFPFQVGKEMLMLEQGVANMVNELEEETKKGLFARTESYWEMMEKEGVSDLGMTRHKARNILHTLFLGLCWPLFAVAYVLNFLPLWYAGKFTDQRVKQIEFHASLRFGAGLLFYFFYWLVLSIIAAVVGNPVIKVLIMGMPILGAFALFYLRRRELWREAVAVGRLSEEKRKSLVAQRKEIMDELAQRVEARKLTTVS